MKLQISLDQVETVIEFGHGIFPDGLTFDARGPYDTS
jgi:hypothetical protein